ncbi:hypothetical protein JN06_00673 [Bacteroides zoogleoformans]|nr:hypothetical protein [Bacteroides zoogleoformans]TWJ17730.1 hypothetical protein JN06_00673 [Bacteroides zoogleoformans]
MKTFSSFFSVLLVIVCCVTCNEYNERVEIYKSTLSGCKSQATSRSNDNSLPHERVVYEVKNGILTIQLIDCNVSCDLEKMDANISCDDHNNLTLRLIEVGGEANCICPMDFSFSIKNLTLGETYTCTIAERNYTFSFVFENGARGTVTPQNVQKK